MDNQVVNQSTYYQLNKEKRLEYQKRYNEEHKQQLKEYQQAYWLKNKHKKMKKKPVVYHPRPKKEKKPKPPKAPVLPSLETIIEQLPPPPPPVQSNIEIINRPIVVSFIWVEGDQIP